MNNHITKKKTKILTADFKVVEKLLKIEKYLYLAPVKENIVRIICGPFTIVVSLSHLYLFIIF